MSEFIPLDTFDTNCKPDCDSLYNNRRAYEIKLSDERLIFDAIPAGELSPIKKVRITNVGYEPLRIKSLTVVGDFIAAMDYQGKLYPGKYYEVAIQFLPSFNGRKTGGLYIDSGDAAGPEFIMLAGYGGDANDPDVQAIYEEGLGLDEFIWIDDELDHLVNITIPSHSL